MTAYGINLFSYTFNPCDYDISEICPIPEGTFSAKGQVNIPSEYADQIPSIAFSIPDLDGEAKLELNNTATGDSVACFQSSISNGKTTKLKSVTYVSAGIAAGALAISGVSTLAGASVSSVGFADVLSWTQAMAMNGMMSVSYPSVYSSFSQNFAWSSGLISWQGMQDTIDSFRDRTGGNTSYSSYTLTQESTIVDYQSGALILLNSTSDDDETDLSRLVKRISLDGIDLSSGNGTGSDGSTTVLAKVAGIARFLEHIMIPNANSFMTVLLFFAIAMAAVVVIILLFRIFIEIWGNFRELPKSIESLRHRYWTFLSSTVIRIIIILYGTWVLYCLYQFKLGDSWACQLLAGITLGIFSIILLGFTVRIFVLARRASKSAGGIDELYEHQPWIRRYGLFYGQFKTQYWWFFVPVLGVAVARSAFIALADGHGMVQVIGQLVVEVILVFALLVLRPFNRRSGNVINVIISVVRIASLICVLIFVEELGVAAETTTIVGVVLIVIQAVLTLLLVLLMVIQALISLFSDGTPDPRKSYIDESEMQPLGDVKTTNSGFAQSTYSIDQKSASALEDIGLAVSEYDPLYSSTGNHGREHVDQSAGFRQQNPWDEERLMPESIPLKRSTSAKSNASSEEMDTRWMKGGLQHDRNGRPIF